MLSLTNRTSSNRTSHFNPFDVELCLRKLRIETDDTEGDSLKLNLKMIVSNDHSISNRMTKEDLNCNIALASIHSDESCGLAVGYLTHDRKVVGLIIVQC